MECRTGVKIMCQTLLAVRKVSSRKEIWVLRSDRPQEASAYLTWFDAKGHIGGEPPDRYQIVIMRRIPGFAHRRLRIQHFGLPKALPSSLPWSAPRLREVCEIVRVGAGEIFFGVELKFWWSRVFIVIEFT